MTAVFYDGGISRRHRALGPSWHKRGRKAQQDMVAFKRRSLQEKPAEAEECRKLEGLLSACVKTVHALAGKGDEDSPGGTLSAATVRFDMLSGEQRRLPAVIDAIDAEGDGGLGGKKASLEVERKWR